MQVLKILYKLIDSPIFRRWINIIFLSAISTVVVLIFHNQLLTIAQKYIDFSAQWPPLLMYSTVSMITAIISFLLIQLGSLNPNFTCKTMIRYPPFWFAVIITSIIITMIFMRESMINLYYVDIIQILLFILAICIGILIGFLQIYIDKPTYNRKFPKTSTILHDKRNIFNSDQDLLSWILEEFPIQYPEDDIFGLEIPARRITKLLLKESPSSIGIVGPYGSGKSSLINLVEYYFNNREKLYNDKEESHSIYSGEIICCKIDGWGRVKGPIAQKILTLAIEQIKRYVDCMSIMTLPENYNKAIAGVKSTGGAIFSALLQTSHDPITQLAKLDDILIAAGLRLVIFLEDLDRNISDPMIKDEMPALLDRLRALRQVSFVLAIGTEQHYSDILIRICDHIEVSGVISNEYMIQTIMRFRKICLKQYPEDIDSLSPDKRSKRLGDVDGKKLANIFSLRYDDPIDDICRLIKTPRLLKLVLRRTLRSWDTLHGELDFDELLISNVIRFSAPEAFDFLLENIQEIRGLQVKSEYSKQEDRLKAVEEKWTNNNRECKWDITSAKRLIQFLFPCWNSSYLTSQNSSIQGIRITSPIDYWSRFLLEELEKDVIKDQEIIKCLKAWKEKPNGIHFRGTSLPTVLCKNKEFAEKFEHFVSIVLNGYDLRKLASAFFAEAINLYDVQTCSDNLPGFIPLWRSSLEQPIDENEHLKWVLTEILKVLPKSLRFVNDISRWINNSKLEVEFQRERTNIKKQVINKAKELFQEKPDYFLKIIDPLDTECSIQFFVYFNYMENDKLSEEWQWFAQLLLEAGNLNKEVIIPQIAGLLVEIQHHRENTTYNFNYSFAEQLFRDKIPQLMKLLATKISLENFENRDSSRINCTNEAAEQWLLQHQNING